MMLKIFHLYLTIILLIANYQIISLVKIAEYLNKAYQDVKLYANKLKKIGIIQNENTKRRKNKN